MDKIRWTIGWMMYFLGFVGFLIGSDKWMFVPFFEVPFWMQVAVGSFFLGLFLLCFQTSRETNISLN